MVEVEVFVLPAEDGILGPLCYVVQSIVVEGVRVGKLSDECVGVRAQRPTVCVCIPCSEVTMGDNELGVGGNGWEVGLHFG